MTDSVPPGTAGMQKGAMRAGPGGDADTVVTVTGSSIRRRLSHAISPAWHPTAALGQRLGNGLVSPIGTWVQRYLATQAQWQGRNVQCSHFTSTLPVTQLPLAYLLSQASSSKSY